MSFFIMILSLSALGFTALASSMSKHQKQFFGKELQTNQTHLAQILGWILLIIVAIYCSIELGIANGLSYWISILTFSGLIVMAALSYCPTRFKHLYIGTVVMFLMGLMFHII